MDKVILMEHFDEIMTVPDISQDKLRKFDESVSSGKQRFQGKYYVVHSSGSTGAPRFFV